MHVDVLNRAISAWGISILPDCRIFLSNMNIEEIREYCLAKPGVTEGFPFNDTALVFKVGGKMFALLDLSEEQRGISLKCDPELAMELREQHPEVTPAYHFNKVIMQLFSTVIKNRSFQFIQILPEKLAFM
jgi:predicted DNA-binding protein (MmcQ/YjbR family)